MIVIKDARGTIIEDGDCVETNELEIGVIKELLQLVMGTHAT